MDSKNLIDDGKPTFQTNNYGITPVYAPSRAAADYIPIIPPRDSFENRFYSGPSGMAPVPSAPPLSRAFTGIPIPPPPPSLLYEFPRYPETRTYPITPPATIKSAVYNQRNKDNCCCQGYEGLTINTCSIPKRRVQYCSDFHDSPHTCCMLI